MQVDDPHDPVPTEYIVGLIWQDWQRRIMFGVDGFEGMGLITETPPCPFVYGVDLARDRDRSVDVAVEVIDGDILRMVLVSGSTVKFQGYGPPIEPKVARDHGRPWVDMKRRPWERKR